MVFKRIAILALGLCLLYGVAQAATIQVNSSSDSASPNECTLRDAIESFNNQILALGCTNLSGEPFRTNDRITFSGALPSKKIFLNGAQLVVESGNSLTIDASLNGGIIVSANDRSRVISIMGSEVTFNFISITDGWAVLTDNGPGGGMSIVNSTINLNNSSVSKNLTSLNIQGRGSDEGGGVYAKDSFLTIDNSSIDGNRAESFGVGRAGGILLSGGSLTLNNSTVSNNVYLGGGGSAGGISANSASVDINNSTLSNNIAGSPFRKGHAIVVNFSTLNIRHSTIVNTNLGEGGGGFTDTDKSVIATNEGSISNTRIALSNTIVFANAGGTCKIQNDRLILEGGNLSSDGNCGTQSSTINLGDLADNGCFLSHATPDGPQCIKTHALLENSSAIDAAIDSNFDRDQRVQLRITGSEDIGAFELMEPSQDQEEFFVVPIDNEKSVIISL